MQQTILQPKINQILESPISITSLKCTRQNILKIILPQIKLSNSYNFLQIGNRSQHKKLYKIQFNTVNIDWFTDPQTLFGKLTKNPCFLFPPILIFILKIMQNIKNNKNSALISQYTHKFL